MIKLENSYRIAYDELTDTLYLSIGEPKKATESYLDEDYVLVRKEHDAITGITIDGFLERHEDGSWKDSLILKYLPKFNLGSLSEIEAFHNSDIDEYCLEGKLIISPMSLQGKKISDGQEPFITEHDLTSERSPRDLVSWVENKIKSIACHKSGKTAIRMKKDRLCKQLMEELYPLSLLAKLEFDHRNDITLQLVMGNQPYDALIRSSDFERKLEITQAHEGETRMLKALMIEEEGWCPGSGGIQKTGSKNKGMTLNWWMGVSNPDDSLDIQTRLIVEAVTKKAKNSKYGNNTDLLVIFDDRSISSLIEDSNQILKQLVSDQLKSIDYNFPVIYVIGSEEKIFFKLEPGC